MTMSSWDNRRDGRSDSVTIQDVQGGNSREICFCPPFMERCNNLFSLGKIPFKIIHCEPLTDLIIDKQDTFTDKGDIRIVMELLGEVREGRMEAKIQPKAYNSQGNLMMKVALKKISMDRCIKTNQSVLVLNRWNPLEYDENLTSPKWLILSVPNLKTLGMDVQGYSHAIPLREYLNSKTGKCQMGWRLYEHRESPVDKYNNKWVDWLAFEPYTLVEEMLYKIWNDLKEQ